MELAFLNKISYVPQNIHFLISFFKNSAFQMKLSLTKNLKCLFCEEIFLFYMFSEGYSLGASGSLLQKLRWREANIGNKFQG